MIYADSTMTLIQPTRKQTVSIYGFALQSDFPFSYPLPVTTRQADLSFSCRLSVPSPERAKQIARWGDQDEIVLTASAHKNGYCMSFNPVLKFFLYPDHIKCDLFMQPYTFLVESYLLGIVLSFWLEWQGVMALHASAVVVGKQAIAFCGQSGDGKSSLAASFVQAGYPLLTDDILAVDGREGSEMVGYAGFPLMRMMPESSQHFVRSTELARVNPYSEKQRIPIDSFYADACPLSAIYLPQRRGASFDQRLSSLSRCKNRERGEINIVRVNASEAFFALVECSFIPYLLHHLDNRQSRWRFLAHLLSQVPIYRLIYPTGFEHLPRVREAILQTM